MDGHSYSNADKRRQMATLSGTQRIRTTVSERPQRSVNRKVQGSNPWSGAKPELNRSTARVGRRK